MAKPMDGQHRLFDPDDHRAWCINLLNSLVDGGQWGVPRSGLTFQRRGEGLVLIARDTNHDARDQQSDYNATKKQFAKAGIEVTDETDGQQCGH